MNSIRKEQLLTMAIVAAVVATFVLVIYLPQRRQLGALTDERQAASQALDRDKAKATELARIRGEVVKMTEQLSFFNRRLPDQQELGQFLKDVSGYAQEAGLSAASFEPQKVITGELYLQMPIDMKLKGSFNNLCRFLKQARSMTRLTSIRWLSVRNDANLLGHCDVDLVMTIYFTRG